MPAKPLDLKALNLEGPRTVRVTMNKAKNEAEVIIYDLIGKDWFGGFDAKDFDAEMKKLPDNLDLLTIRINSPGGSVFEGMTIYHRIKQHKAKKKKVYIDGLAASIASIIALAGDEVIMGEGAFYMIHLPWAPVAGNRMELENLVGILMELEESFLGIYSRKSGLDKTEIRQMLEKETWLGAQEALDKGFVTSVIEDSIPIAASALEHKWMLKAPKKYFSADKLVREQNKNLRNEISTLLSRK